MIKTILILIIAFTNISLFTLEKKHFVTCEMLGRLGNELFEVAVTCALAWDNDAEPCFLGFSKEEYEHIFFRCNSVDKTLLKDVKFKYAETSQLKYNKIPFHPDMIIAGYFQHEKYFAHHRDRIIKLFKPHDKDIEYIKKKYGWIVDNPNSVSIHVRGYNTEQLSQTTFIQYDREYFEKAMNLFPESSLFIVTSDNPKFAREQISIDGRDIVFITGEKHYIDFFIQTMCKHNIISNSSFSWWSAYLNTNPNKIVVRPKVWLGGYPDMSSPDDWIKIDANGVQLN